MERTARNHLQHHEPQDGGTVVMIRSASGGAKENRLLRLTLLAAVVGLALALPAHGQVSPEEHEKHHGGGGKGPPGNIPPAGPMAGMMDCGVGMGANQPKELY